MTACLVTACLLAGPTTAKPSAVPGTLALKQQFKAGDRATVTYSHDLDLAVTFVDKGSAGKRKADAIQSRVRVESEGTVEFLSADGRQAVLTYKKAVRTREENGEKGEDPLPWHQGRLRLPTARQSTAKPGARREAWRLLDGDLLPTKPVAVGDSWTVTRTRFLEFLLQLPSGTSVSCTASLDRVATTRGHRCAEIGLAIAAVAPLQDMTLSYSLTGQMWLSLDVGKVIGVTVDGPVRVAGQPGDPSLADRLSGKGRVQARLARQWPAPTRPRVATSQPAKPRTPPKRPKPVTAEPTAEEIAILKRHWQTMVDCLKETPASTENRRRFTEAYLDLQPEQGELVALVGQEGVAALQERLKEAFNAAYLAKLGRTVEQRKLTVVAVRPDDKKFVGGTFVRPTKTYAVVLRPASGKGVIVSKFVYINDRWILVGR